MLKAIVVGSMITAWIAGGGQGTHAGDARINTVTQAGKGIAVISELEADEPGRLTGRFVAHWESETGREVIDGPAGVSIDEAIAWGRRHAKLVSVLLGDEDVPYSAGKQDLPGEAVRAWPKEGMVIRARPFGTPLDGSEQEASWRLSSAVRLQTSDRGVASRLKAILARDPRVETAGVEVSAAGIMVTCRFRARGIGIATVEVDRLVEHAVLTILPSLRRAGQLDITTTAHGRAR